MGSTRECWVCDEAKSINGMWCLLAGQEQGMFVCGSCSGLEGASDLRLA